MTSPRRILVGTMLPGGATCLAPVVRELRSRPHVEVYVLAAAHARDVFRDNGIAFSDLTNGRDWSLSDEGVRAALADLHPDAVVTGVFGPRDGQLDHRLIRAARHAGIQSVGVLDAWMNYATRFSDPDTGDPLAFLPDLLAVPDQGTVAELVAEGIPAERQRVTGHPFLGVLRRQVSDEPHIRGLRQAVGVQPGERCLVFFSEPVRWGADEGLSEPVGYDEIEVFDLLCRALAAHPELALLVVREHPRHASLTVPDRIGPIRVVRNQSAPALDLLLAADVVIGMSSTLLVYAYVAGRRVVAIQPGRGAGEAWRGGLDYNMLTRRGLLTNRGDVAGIAAALAESPKGDENTLRKARLDLGWDGFPCAAVANLVLEGRFGAPQARDLEPKLSVGARN